MDNKLWFRRKSYGRGWTPCTWEGWGCILLFLLGLYSVTRISQQVVATVYVLLASYVTIVVLVAFLIMVCYAKGEKPRRQWGCESCKKNH